MAPLLINNYYGLLRPLHYTRKAVRNKRPLEASQSTTARWVRTMACWVLRYEPRHAGCCGAYHSMLGVAKVYRLKEVDATRIPTKTEYYLKGLWRHMAWKV